MSPRKAQVSGDASVVVRTEGDGSQTAQPMEQDSELLAILKGVAHSVENLSGVVSDLSVNVGDLKKRVATIETGGKEAFRNDAKAEDIESAKVTRQNIDPRINAIVDEMLGEDFGVSIDPYPDRPGFLFTLIVPTRLSDNVSDRRPVIDSATGQYKKDSQGNVITEDYYPEDRRSRAISSVQSYDAIKQHCEKVRSHIVGYYQKMSQPLPEFRVK